MKEIIRDTVRITPPKMEEKFPYIRVEEAPIKLTRDMERHLGIVTAHNLDDYSVKFYKVKVEESTDNWFLKLLQQDFDRKEEIGYVGKSIYKR